MAAATEPAPAPAAPSTASSRWRATLLAASLALTAMPFLAVDVPPLADLPQHAAQLRLFGEVLDGDSPYAIQWGTPYSLVYLVLAAARALVAPWAGEVAAAKAGAAAVAILWAAAVHLLAWRFRRPAAAAVVASTLVFSHVLYWGFLPFMMGFPLFALWVAALEREAAAATFRRRAAQVAAVTALAVLLYLAHALWFAAALAWLAVDSWRQRQQGVESHALAIRAAGPVLIAALATAWFNSISGTSFATPPVWVPGWWWRRLLPGAWVEAAFGGLAGDVETLALAAIVLWLGLAVWGARRQLREQAGVTLGLLGGLLFAAALVLPDKYVNTIEFHDRWMPPALALLVLAAPPLRLPRAAARGLAVLLLAGFVTVTTHAWRQVERYELAGLEAALAALPEEPRVLGLDFVRHSRWLDHEPFLQTFAWSQVVHGGELNFSFADFAPSLVVYRPRRQAPWTPGLEWLPQFVRPGDFGWFDHVVVRAPPALHRQLEAAPFLQPATPPAPWRLYRVAPDAPRERFPWPPLTPRTRSTAPPAPTAPG